MLTETAPKFLVESRLMAAALARGFAGPVDCWWSEDGSSCLLRDAAGRGAIRCEGYTYFGTWSGVDDGALLEIPRTGGAVVYAENGSVVSW